MVTRAGKELLKNTIRTVDHHNRILEEQEMWRQWEREQGLTMMVSDDVIYSHSFIAKARKSTHSHKLHKKTRVLQHKKSSSNSGSGQEKNYWMKKLDKDPNRWGHSGYKELYPEEFQSSSSYRQTSKSNKFVKRKSKKRKKHYKKHSKHCSISVTESSSESSSDNELRHNFQNAKRGNRIVHEMKSKTKAFLSSEESTDSNIGIADKK